MLLLCQCNNNALFNLVLKCKGAALSVLRDETCLENCIWHWDTPLSTAASICSTHLIKEIKKGMLIQQNEVPWRAVTFLEACYFLFKKVSQGLLLFGIPPS